MEVKGYNFFSDFMTMTPEQWGVHDKEIAGKLKEYEEHKKMEVYEASGAPERFLKSSLDTFVVKTKEQKIMLESAKTFVKTVQCGNFASLSLIGHSGVGKTHIGCGILRECGGVYRSISEIIDDIHRSKSFGSTTTESKILDYYGKLPLLVVDEIGRGLAQSDEKYALYQVINSRYNKKKSTVIISNLEKQEFLQYIGRAAVDRLTESGLTLELTGESYRPFLRKTGT